jgi:hypothetical protein
VPEVLKNYGGVSLVDKKYLPVGVIAMVKEKRAKMQMVLCYYQISYVWRRRIAVGESRLDFEASSVVCSEWSRVWISGPGENI